MSETECQHCGARYAYFGAQLRPDGTVSCQNCGMPIENPSIGTDEPMAERGASYQARYTSTGLALCLIANFVYLLTVVVGNLYGWIPSLVVVIIGVAIPTACWKLVVQPEENLTASSG